MKTIFDKDFRYTLEAQVFGIKARDALEPLFDEYLAYGYSPRELEYNHNP